MATELESLMVRLMGDGSSYQRMIQQAHASTARLADQIQFHSQRIQGFGMTLRGFGQTALGTAAGYAAVLGVGTGINAVQGAVTRFMDQEKTEIAFEALIGNAELAKKTLADLRKFAADTPFEQPEIMAAAKQMIAFGESAENIVPTMKKLGDVSAGLNIPLGQLTYLFGTLKAQGRAMTVDINQFAMRGIPIWAELEKITGKSNAEVRKMVETGQVGFPLVEQAFENMTKEGGRFHGQLEKQSQSLAGLVSTLKDNVGMVLSDVGRKFVEVFGVKDVIRGLGDAAQEAGRWLMFGFDKATDFGNAVRSWINTTGVQWLRDLADGARTFAAENPKLILGIGLTAAAVLSGVVAFKALSVAMSIALGVAGLLHLDQLVGIAGWIAYSGVVLAAKFVTLAFSAAQFVAANATWFLDAAIAVLEAETVVPLIAGLAAAAVAVEALAIVFGALGTTLYATAMTGSKVLDLLMQVPTSAGPIKEVGDLFSGWQTTLMRIADVAKKDLPAAWGLLGIAGRLAVSQLKDLWPPLWNFTKTGFTALWTEVRLEFVQQLSEGIRIIFKMMNEFKNYVKNSLKDAFTPGGNAEAEQAAAAAGSRLVDLLAPRDAGKAWELKIREMMQKFKEEFKASPETEALAKELEDAFKLQDLKQKWRDAVATNTWGGVADGKKKAEDQLPLNLKVVPKFDAAAFNSVEAAARIAEFRDRLGINPSQPGGRKAEPVHKVAEEPTETKADPAELDLLQKILDALGGSFGKKMEIAPAEFYDA